MQPEDLMRQYRDVGAALAGLMDHEVEILSVHIGPTNHPPTVRIAAGKYSEQLRAASRLNPYSGEQFVCREGVEIAWVESADLTHSARMHAAIAQAERFIDPKSPTATGGSAA